MASMVGAMLLDESHFQTERYSRTLWPKGRDLFFKDVSNEVVVSMITESASLLTEPT